MMPKYITFGIIAGSIVLYILFCFVTMRIDPRSWDTDVRLLYVVLLHLFILLFCWAFETLPKQSDHD